MEVNYRYHVICLATPRVAELLKQLLVTVGGQVEVGADKKRLLVHKLPSAVITTYVATLISNAGGTAEVMGYKSLDTARNKARAYVYHLGRKEVEAAAKTLLSMTGQDYRESIHRAVAKRDLYTKASELWVHWYRVAALLVRWNSGVKEGDYRKKPHHKRRGKADDSSKKQKRMADQERLGSSLSSEIQNKTGG